MRAEKLIYTFVSYAYYADYSWGHGCPEEGFMRTAKVAHKYGIPVSWILNRGSIGVFKDQIREWHELYGDDVILRCPPYDDATGNIDKLIKDLEEDWQLFSEAFPWAKTKVAARGKISSDIINALESQDFKGVWGYCWEQSWWDGITHRGIPWGSWYVNPENTKAPHSGKGKIVASEWTARDLNLSYHAKSPCIFSTDPDDVYRAGLCTGDNIEYWKKVFDDYLRNTDNNEDVFLVQQQESHEMENTENFAVWPMSQILESEKMLDNFFKYIKGFDITITTLPKAIEQYHENNEITAPCYMLTSDSKIRPEINEYTMTLGGVALGPWPETFFYYDSQCQMAFLEGDCKPQLLRNYSLKASKNDECVDEVPPVFVTKYQKSDELIEVVFEIDEWRPIPFGLTYWGALEGFQLKCCDDVIETKIIQDKLIFIRLNLTGEKKRISLTLEKK